MSSLDVMNSLQQLQATFASLAGTTSAGSASGTDTSASSADFDSLVAAMSLSLSSPSSSSPTSSSPLVSGTGTAAAAGTPLVSSATPGTVTGSDVVADAEKYLGVPYVLDGESTSGMDCSGLVQKVYGDLGISLTRGVSTQKLQGTPVASLADAQPGDLIVFKGGGHIGIYAGNDMVIHAPYPGRDVSLQKLWVGDSGIDTIRRIVPSASGDTSGLTSATSLSSGGVTLAQAQAALTSAAQAVMQADLAMMSSSGSASGSPSTTSTDPDALTSALDGGLGTSDSTAADPTASDLTSSDSTAAIQQFLAAQQSTLTGGAS